MKVLSLIFCAVFITFSSSLTYKCSFELFGWAVIGNSYTCYNASINLENTEDVNNVTGNHLSRYSNIDVLAFDVQDQNILTQIPLGLEKFFPNLLLIRWYGGALETIDSGVLEPFPKLLVLVLLNNRIFSLDGDLLRNNPKLQFLTFSNNLIEHVGHDLLANQPDLETLFFTTNPCINLFSQDKTGIERIKIALRAQCPALETTTIPTTFTTTLPSTTSTTISPPATTFSTPYITTPVQLETCPMGCIMKAEFLEEKINELSQKIFELSIKMSDLQLSNFERKQQFSETVDESLEEREKVASRRSFVNDLRQYKADGTLVELE